SDSTGSVIQGDGVLPQTGAERLPAGGKRQEARSGVDALPEQTGNTSRGRQLGYMQSGTRDGGVVQGGCCRLREQEGRGMVLRQPGTDADGGSDAERVPPVLPVSRGRRGEERTAGEG